MIDMVAFVERENTPLADSMRKLNFMIKRILFLVDASGKLMGTLTDGDIRRHILSGGHIDDESILAANKNPVVAYGVEEARRLLEQKYIAIPVLDSEGILIDIFEGDNVQRKYARINLPVVINAGGKGTRLDPFTRVLPKPLIPVGDLPIIELIMQEYERYDCSEFHIIVNYKKDLLKAYFIENNNLYNIVWHDEDRPLGTGGGLTLLRDTLHSTFFFVNCDVLLKADCSKILEFHKDNGNMVTMVCAYKDVTIPYGVVDIGINGEIVGMREKPKISFLTNTGIYLVEPDVIDYMSDNEKIGFPDVIQRIIDKGGKVAVFPVAESDWMDMGQLPELEKMRIRITEGI